ncbi:MAG TPA: class I SAM-dependent methyltransferase [Opitutus sp.]|nr:class I SAM-dependent methyltransferase [Opitutus sp.]
MTARPSTSRILQGLRAGGLRWLAGAIYNRAWPARLAMKPAVEGAMRGRSGLEVGGPSRVFEARGLLPVYPAAARVDNVNFSAQTTWEADLRDGGEFIFDRGRPPGRQLIRDATALTGIADASYDFVLSSHCLEHVANPLRALREWRRVTRPHGHLVLLLPDPKRSFDHRRPVTTLAHLREDLAHGTGEDDTTHVPEALALHDLARDPWAGSPEAFRARLQHNAENRCLHHHVFDLALATAVLRETGWKVLAAEIARPVHLVVFGQNCDEP